MMSRVAEHMKPYLKPRSTTQTDTGKMATKERKKAVLSQLIAEELTL
jgi:hypothetical protein